MSFMVDLRIDIRTKEMLNITPCKECCLRLPFTVIGPPFTRHCWPRVHGIKIIAPCGSVLELC